VVYASYDERKKAYVKSTSRQWKRGKVVDVEWMHLTFGRWINIGYIKICFDDGTVERIRANLVKVYSEPFDPSTRPKEGKPIKLEGERDMQRMQRRRKQSNPKRTARRRTLND
jgi:hypothetical protein